MPVRESSIGSRHRLRLALVLTVTIGVGALAFLVPKGGVFAFAAFPILLLAIAWFGARGGRYFALGIATIALAAAFAQVGPFTNRDTDASLIVLAVFLLILGVAATTLPTLPTVKNVALPSLVVLIGWLLSGWIFLLLQGEAARRQDEFFRERVAEAQSSIFVRMTSYADALRGGASFFAASTAVRRDDWRVYGESLQLKRRYPGINGLGVIFAVPPAQLDDWLTRMRQDGVPQMKVYPFPGTTASPDAPNYIITYVEPIGTNTPSLGRNIGTEPTRRTAAERARDLGEAQLHRRAEGSRDLKRRSGLLMYYPLYAKGAALDTVADRRAALIGWVYAQIFPDIFLDRVLGPTGDFLQLHLFEDAELKRERLLYASTPSPAFELPEFDHVTRLEMAGQPFYLAWRRGPKFPRMQRAPAIWTASSFAAATLLLAGLIMSLQSTGRRANAIAAERTAELATSEERFRHAFEFAGTGMAIVGLDGRWMRVNKSMCEIVGYSESELLQKTFQDITHPDDLAADLGLLDELVKGRRRSYQMEKRYHHREGRIVWVRLNVSLVRDSAGQPVHFISQIEDITVPKQLAENLARVRDEALEASRLKSEFLATMSHEIRTPMNGVIGMTALLRDTPLTATQADYVRTIETSGESLLTIINGILDYSKIEAGRLELEVATFELRQCVEDALTLFHGRAQAKGLQLGCTIAAGVPLRVAGDATRLRQIIVNLLDNAIKFTDRGEVALTVHAEPAEKNGGRQRLHFAIRDTGIGIPPDGLQRLFKSFSQVDATTTRRYGGTGLGLAISKRLAELMGGTMWVQSRPGAGSTFQFTVLVEPQPEIAEVRPVPEQSIPDSSLGERFPLRLLIAEDNPVNQRVAALLLRRLGYAATTVNNGVEAVAAIQASDYDAILMDIEMPELDGFEATRRIRTLRQSNTAPWIIALTAAITHNDRERAAAVGMNDFLTKPVRSEMLAAALTRAHAALKGQSQPGNG